MLFLCPLYKEEINKFFPSNLETSFDKFLFSKSLMTKDYYIFSKFFFNKIKKRNSLLKARNQIKN